MMLGTNNYAVLLIPIRTAPQVSGMDRSDYGTDPFADSPVGAQDQAGDTGSRDYIYFSTTLYTSILPPALAQVLRTEGRKAITEDQWIDFINDLLIADGAPNALVNAARDDVIPDSTGAWPIAAADECVPTSADLETLRHAGEEDRWMRRVVLLGDAAHAMPPQG